MHMDPPLPFSHSSFLARVALRRSATKTHQMQTPQLNFCALYPWICSWAWPSPSCSRLHPCPRRRKRQNDWKRQKNGRKRTWLIWIRHQSQKGRWNRRRLMHWIGISELSLIFMSENKPNYVHTRTWFSGRFLEVSQPLRECAHCCLFFLILVWEGNWNARLFYATYNTSVINGSTRNDQHVLVELE
jgi:hypothetical protein